MNRPTIFLSHITEEAALASILKSEIDKNFLGMVDVFQSSDRTSSKIGTNWLDNITTALRNCEAIIVLCSPHSIGRPWINFECGAGWARDIYIAPLCHSGLRPVDLPVPISSLQGISANDPTAIVSLFAMIAEKLSSKTPNIDAQAIIDKISEFSHEYTRHTDIVLNLRGIKEAEKKVIEVFKGIPARITTPINDVPELVVNSCRSYLKNLQARGLMSFSYSVMGIGFGGTGGGGNFGTLTVNLEQDLVDVLLKDF